jgi:hypothetical protein
MVSDPNLRVCVDYVWLIQMQDSPIGDYSHHNSSTGSIQHQPAGGYGTQSASLYSTLDRLFWVLADGSSQQAPDVRQDRVEEQQNMPPPLQGGQDRGGIRRRHRQYSRLALISFYIITVLAFTSHRWMRQWLEDLDFYIETIVSDNQRGRQARSMIDVHDDTAEEALGYHGTDFAARARLRIDFVR